MRFKASEASQFRKWKDWTKMLFKNFRALFFTLLIILSFGLLAGPAVFAQERDWQPQRTWVFIVGTLKWKHSDVLGSFPQKNRRDAQLVDFFRQQGVHADQLVYLQDAQATTRRVKSCYSGSLAQQTRGMNRRVSYAALTSASADELSTESWTFTEMLLAGLRGKAFADINGDGRVTLGEPAEDVNEDMAFAEEQQSSLSPPENFCATSCWPRPRRNPTLK